MNAFRTIREDDDVFVIEGLGYPYSGPFNGKDSYGTTFSARTDFVWDLFPDSMTEPRFIRPVTFDHGFDATIGLRRVGGWSPVRADASGTWVQAQIDKHDQYYSAIRELLDKDKLGFSGGSASHAVRINNKTGEVLQWPAYELSLTPIPSNPFAQIAARSAEVANLLVAIHPAGYVPPAGPAVRWSDAASDAAMGAGAMGTVLYLLGSEADEPDQVAILQRALDALSEWVDAERAEIGTDEDVAESETVYAYYSAQRAAAAKPVPATPPEDATRTAENGPAMVAIVPPAPATLDAAALRAIGDKVATVAGEAVARRMFPQTPS